MILLRAASRKCESVEVKTGAQRGKIKRDEMQGAERDGSVKGQRSCSD